MTATMTNAEFERWWEGLSQPDHDFETYNLLGHNFYGRDRSWVTTFEECIPGYGEIWECAGEILDYARTHEPSNGIPGAYLQTSGGAYNGQWKCVLWGTQGWGKTGPAAVQKAFVKAHKVTP